MTNIQILFQATIKMIRIFPLVLPVLICGLAVLAVEERRKEMDKEEYIKLLQSDEKELRDYMNRSNNDDKFFSCMKDTIGILKKNLSAAKRNRFKKILIS